MFNFAQSEISRRILPCVGENAQLAYWLTGPDAEFFEVNEKTGQVSIRRGLDRESRDLLTFQIHCSDRGTPALNASAEVIVTITDVNDNAPEIPGHVEFSVMENHTAGESFSEQMKYYSNQTFVY